MCEGQRPRGLDVTSEEGRKNKKSIEVDIKDEGSRHEVKELLRKRHYKG